MNQLTLWETDSMLSAIVTTPNPDEAQQYAVEQLSHYLEQMSGKTIPVKTSVSPNAVNFIIGQDACAAAGFIPDTDLTDEGLMIETRGANIFVTGTHPRGTLYAVYELLEEFLGCRFFSPEIEVIPKRSKLTINPISHKYVPPIEYRSSSVYQLLDPVYAVKRRLNGQECTAKAKFGGRVQYGEGYFVHTFCRHLLKPEEYFDEHPEYYAEIDGKRIREKTQLCLTNPDVLKLVTQQILKDIRNQPQAKIYSLSQEDNYNGCTCENCRKLNEYEGSQSGTLLHFVNAVAEEVEKEFPDVVIDTLAYQYTRRPPKYVHARKNVCVRLCSIECCFVHPLSECTTDDPDAPRKDYAQSFRDDLIGWGEKCNRVYIWDYVTNFSHFWMPHPNLHVLAENMKFFTDHNVRGIFEQGCGSPTGGEMNDLRAYILAKAMWNPNCNPAELRAEFLNAAYGNAAVYIDEYLETVYHAVIDAQCHLYCFNHPDKPWHKMELVERCEALFQKAKLVAANETILKRIQFQEMAVRYLRILLTPKGSQERNDLIDAFRSDMKKFGITMLWERKDADTCLNILKGEEDPGYWWAN